MLSLALFLLSLALVCACGRWRGLFAELESAPRPASLYERERHGIAVALRAGWLLTGLLAWPAIAIPAHHQLAALGDGAWPLAAALAILAAIFGSLAAGELGARLARAMPRAAEQLPGSRGAKLLSRFGERIERLGAPLERGLRRIGEPAGDQLPFSERLRLLIEAANGDLPAGAAEMITGILDLHERCARDVMTPFHAVAALSAAASCSEGIELCSRSHHSRLVVFDREHPEQVVGVAHATALAQALLVEGPEAPVERALHEVPLVPETKSLAELLNELRAAHSSLAVVLDEYGRGAGVVTVEDILEEAVGEIIDETDLPEQAITRSGEERFVIRGEVSLADVRDEGIELDSDSASYGSLGGLVFTELGRAPRRGDKVQVSGWELEVLQTKRSRITLVRVSRAQD